MYSHYECYCPYCKQNHVTLLRTSYGEKSELYRINGRIVQPCKKCLNTLDYFETVCPDCGIEKQTALPIGFGYNPDVYRINGKIMKMCNECKAKWGKNKEGGE